MNADERRLLLDEITEQIIRLAYKVSNALGCGFLEKVYENALALELRECGYEVQQQARIAVKYRGQIIGEYIGDLLVNQQVVIELKCVKNFDEIMYAQCLNYLKATGLTVCLLLNFAKPRIDIKRFVNNF
jgi:GxxExxY protein